MTIADFKAHLLTSPSASLRFVLPDNDTLPAHVHITEVGRVDKTFMDCGGTLRSSSTCLLQAWTGNDVDHRLTPERLARAIEKAEGIPLSPSLEVEIEYEDCAMSQFPVLEARISEGELRFLLGAKHTDCLAKEVCIPDGGNADTGTCC